MWGDPTSIEKNTFKDCSKLTDLFLYGFSKTIDIKRLQENPLLQLLC